MEKVYEKVNMTHNGLCPNTLRILHEMKKGTDIITRTRLGNTHIQPKEVEKKGTIFGSIMCRTEKKS